MERGTITRTWGIAAVIILAIIGLVVAFLLVSAPPRIQAGQACGPVMTIQWKAQSVLESKFIARVIEDNEGILRAFKGGKGLEEGLAGTYLKKLRVWKDTEREWIGGKEAFVALADLLKGMNPDTLSIDSISIVIDYLPYVEGASVETDVDAVATIRMTFSASPGGNIVEGELLHRRVCPII